jgi:DedD protein
MQKEAVPDLELNLKKKARRRLVGAITLVLLMMILLPMLLKDRDGLTKHEAVKITMDNEAPVLTEGSAVENVMPTQKAPQVELPAQNNTPEPVVETANVTPTTIVEKNEAVQVLALPNQNATPATESKPKEPKVVVTETVVKEAVVQTAPVAENKVVEVKKPVVEKLVIEKPVKTEAAEDKKSTSGKSYFVQVGVFSDPANVKRLQTQLTQLGFKAQTEKVNTSKGEKIRLRTTTFASRNDAANALQKIKNAGLTGMVVRQ